MHVLVAAESRDPHAIINHDDHSDVTTSVVAHGVSRFVIPNGTGAIDLYKLVVRHT